MTISKYLVYAFTLFLFFKHFIIFMNVFELINKSIKEGIYELNDDKHFDKIVEIINKNFKKKNLSKSLDN